MKVSECQELEDCIRSISDSLRLAGEKISMAEVRRQMKEQHPEVYAASMPYLAEIGLSVVTRRSWKTGAPPATKSAKQIALDFGMTDFDIDEMIAIPVLLDQPLGAKVWKDLEDLTIPEALAAIAHLDAQASNDKRRRDQLSTLIARAIEVIGSDTELTIGDAAELARERNSK